MGTAALRHFLAIMLLPLLWSWAVVATAQTPSRPADQILHGAITGADHEQYRRVPFDLPSGVDRLFVSFEHDGQAQRTVIDLGIEDPHGLRGASGGNKSYFTLSATDATPSYLPGPLDAGPWQLVLGIPNARAGSSAQWTARLWFLRGAEAQIAPVRAVQSRGPGWYRGDMHLHSAHSDGNCASQTGTRVPCPLFRTLAAATTAGLDFVMLTEHNTTSHHSAIIEAQPYFDRLLLIPGREVTTFYGHFNIFGVTSPIDYRIQPGGPISFDSIADQVHALGGLVAINHPGMPSGELCMGCGWTMPAADLARADLIEAVNGGSMASTGGNPRGPFGGIAFWQRNGALRGIAPIGGSDSHDPDRAGLSAPGWPATVVYADDLTASAIMAGLRRGQLFIDLTGRPTSRFALSLCARATCSMMGQQLTARRRAVLRAEIDVVIEGAAMVSIIDATDGRVLTTVPSSNAQRVTLPPLSGAHAIYATVEDGEGKILAMTNSVRVTVQ